MTTYAGPGPWGPGKSSPLSQAEFDGNNYGFENRITDLETSPPQPNDIVGITLTGSFLSMTQRDGTILGPVPFSPPMARWRNEWAISTAYVAFDFVTVSEVGLYGVLRDHTSDDTAFDGAAIDIDGNLLYRKVIGFSGTSATLGELLDVELAGVASGYQLTYDDTDPDNPVWVGKSLTDILDDGIGDTQGSFAYRNATEWVDLTPGTVGQVLTTGGAAANPSWEDASSGGTPTGSSGDLQTNDGAGGFGAITPASGIATFLATPSSANLRAALTDEVGPGSAYFVGGALGTPASGTATNLTGLPVSGIASVSNLRVIANVSGGAASPSANTMSAILDAVFGSTRGEIISRGASAWGGVSPGKSGYTLQLNSSLDPTWVQVASGGKGGTTGTAPSNWLLGADYATDAVLAANTYSNGSSGVGATLTGNSNGAISVDGSSPIVNDRILVKDEVSGAHNGVYSVTTVGSGGTAYVLTRATDYDQTTEIVQGSAVAVAGGTANAGTAWVLGTSSSITIGSTSLDYDSLTAQLPDLAAGQVLGNSNSFTAPATPTSQSAIFDRAFSSTRGSILYRGSSAWDDLAPGTSGYVLTSGGAGADPSWTATGSGGVGDVSGGSTSTDGEIAAYNGTGGKTIKRSFVTFSGPATSTKTYTLPNSPATILTDDAAVTIVQGGTGATSASGTVLDNITGFSATGILKRTGAGAYSFVTAPSGTVVGTTDSQTLTTKTIDGANNTLTVRAASDITGTLPVANGGTGQTSYTNGQVLIGNTSGNTLAKTTLTAGSNITITNGAGAITISASGAGGVGGGLGLFANLIPVTAPSLASTGWTASPTWGNQGSAAVADVSNGIRITAPSNGSTQSSRGVYFTAPATPYTYTGLIAVNSVGPGATVNSTNVQFGWTDGTKLEVLEIGYDSTNTRWWSCSRFTASNFTGTGATANSAGVINGNPKAFQISDDGTNIIMRLSADGVTFNVFQTVLKSTGSLGSGGYTSIWFGTRPFSVAMDATLMAWVQS